MVCVERKEYGIRVQGSGFRVEGAGFRVQGSRFRVWPHNQWGKPQGQKAVTTLATSPIRNESILASRLPFVIF